MLSEKQYLVYGYWSGGKPSKSPDGIGLYGSIIQFNLTYRTPQIIFDTNGMWYRIKSTNWGNWNRLAITT